MFFWDVSTQTEAISTSIGTLGGGIGYQGITPSIGITIDTWQNSNNSDPAFDHIAIHRNGDIDHFSPNNLAGPIAVLAGSDNIEYRKWHTLRVVKLSPGYDTIAAQNQSITLQGNGEGLFFQKRHSNADQINKKALAECKG